MMDDLKDYLQTSTAARIEEQLLDDIAYTLSCGRTKFQWSASWQVTSVSDLLCALCSEKKKPVKSNGVPRLGFGKSCLLLRVKHSTGFRILKS